MKLRKSMELAAGGGHDPLAAGLPGGGQSAGVLLRKDSRTGPDLIQSGIVVETVAKNSRLKKRGFGWEIAPCAGHVVQPRVLWKRPSSCPRQKAEQAPVGTVLLEACVVRRDKSGLWGQPNGG